MCALTCANESALNKNEKNTTLKRNNKSEYKTPRDGEFKKTKNL
jgi:hypothetical protein